MEIPGFLLQFRWRVQRQTEIPPEKQMVLKATNEEFSIAVTENLRGERRDGWVAEVELELVDLT